MANLLDVPIHRLMDELSVSVASNTIIPYAQRPFPFVRRGSHKEKGLQNRMCLIARLMTCYGLINIALSASRSS
jgi:hypothetical protein